MPHRSHDDHALRDAMPLLSPGEWRDVQRALRALQDSAGPPGQATGPLRRSIARLIPRLRGGTTVTPELQPLRDFLCETARHGPAAAELAQRLERSGYSPAQIAALALIAG